jgi:hypothetical protein
MDFNPEQAYWSVRFVLVLLPAVASVWAFVSKNLSADFALDQVQ